MDDPQLTTDDVCRLLAQHASYASALELAADIIACQQVVIARLQQGALGCWTVRTSTSTPTCARAKRSTRGGNGVTAAA
jgi:hypothetical protein